MDHNNSLTNILWSISHLNSHLLALSPQLGKLTLLLLDLKSTLTPLSMILDLTKASLFPYLLALVCFSKHLELAWMELM